MDDDYTLVPEKEILKLKKRIDELEKNPLGESESAQNLKDSVNSLNNTLSQMIEIFKEAQETFNSETEDDVLMQKLDPVFHRLDRLEEQNKKIATGILALADLVKEKMSENKHPIHHNNQQNMPQTLPHPTPPKHSGSNSMMLPPPPSPPSAPGMSGANPKNKRFL